MLKTVDMLSDESGKLRLHGKNSRCLPDGSRSAMHAYDRVADMTIQISCPLRS